MVDVGSRALRMTVGEVAPGRPLRRLETLSVPVAIGVDTFARGSIRAVTTEVVVKTLRDFAQVLKGYEIEPASCRVAATTAVRDARNREVFLDRVESRTGFRIDIVEAIEETRLALQLVRHLMGPAFDTGTALVLALGAGGTHLIIQQNGELRLAETLHFGMLRLRETPASEQTVLRSAGRFLAKVAASVDRLHDLSPVETMVVVNSELYAVVDALVRCRRSKVGLEVRRPALEKLGVTLDQLTTQELADDTALDHASAELARMAFEEARAFCVPTATQRIIFPACTMLDSLLLDAQLRLPPPIGRNEGVSGLAESAAWSIARRYRADEAHAAKVKELGLNLFDELQELVGLGASSRLLLIVAAILHDIGFYVSTHDHAAHSAYLIAKSEIMGLTGEDLSRVALIVRYHRRSVKSVEDIDLGHLHAPERVELLKLIALLRLADALDADHRQGVRRVRVHTTADELYLLAETCGGERDSFLDLERAFRAKAGLCEELLGMAPQLTEVLAT